MRSRRRKALAAAVAWCVALVFIPALHLVRHRDDHVHLVNGGMLFTTSRSIHADADAHVHVSAGHLVVHRHDGEPVSVVASSLVPARARVLATSGGAPRAEESSASAGRWTAGAAGAPAGSRRAPDAFAHGRNAVPHFGAACLASRDLFRRIDLALSAPARAVPPAFSREARPRRSLAGASFLARGPPELPTHV